MKYVHQQNSKVLQATPPAKIAHEPFIEWMSFYKEIFQITLNATDFLVPNDRFTGLMHTILIAGIDLQLLIRHVAGQKKAEVLDVVKTGMVSLGEHNNYVRELMPVPEYVRNTSPLNLIRELAVERHAPTLKEVLLLALFLKWKYGRIDFFDGLYTDDSYRNTITCCIPCYGPGYNPALTKVFTDFPVIVVHEKRELEILECSSIPNTNEVEIIQLY